MPKFAVIKINDIIGKQGIYKLIINGRCEFDEFCNWAVINGQQSKLSIIYARLQFIANLQYEHLPSNKFRQLKRDRKDPYPDYEIKVEALRIYLIKDKETGQIIVTWGMKGTQDQDINRLRRIKKEYFETKTKKN